MTKRLVNPVEVRPDQLQDGDVMAVTVTCHISEGAGGLTYRLHRCQYPLKAWRVGFAGFRINNEETVATQLFPVVRSAKAIPDY